MLHGILLQASMESALSTILLELSKKFSTFMELGQAIGGLGSIAYIFYRIWGHLSRGEEIDLFPLFRPIALAFCLLFYAQITNSILAIGQSLDTGTRTLVTEQDATIRTLTAQKKQALKDKASTIILNPDINGDGEVSFWDKFLGAIPGVAATTLMNNAMNFGISYFIDQALVWIGRQIYDIASLAIKFMMTFFLTVMLITGPITIGLACFEWFYGGLSAWVARIIHLLLWIPIVNVLSGLLQSVEVVMLRIDISQINNTPTNTFQSNDFGMIAFYLIGTMGYLFVPKVASWVIESTGAGNAMSSIGRGLSAAGSAVGAAAGMAAGPAGAAIGAKLGSGGSSGSSSGATPPVPAI